MEFLQLQEGILQVADQYSATIKAPLDEELALLKLFEEAGEFAQAVLIYRRKCRPEKYLDEETAKEFVAAELADILSVVVILARVYGIDLEKAVASKLFSKLQKN